MKEERHDWSVTTSTMIRGALVAIAAITAVAIVIRLRPVLLLLVMALFLAIALDPLVRLLQRKGISRGLSTGLVSGVGGALLVGLFWLLGAPLADQFGGLMEALPKYIEDMRQSSTWENFNRRTGAGDHLKGAEDAIGAFASSVVGGGIAMAMSALASTVLVMFMTFLMLLYGPEFVHQALETFPQIAHRKSWLVIEATYYNIARYVGGSVIVALIAGLSSFIAMLIIGVEQPLPLALWITVFSLVPILGALIGSLPALLIALMDEPWKAGALLLFIIIYQQLEGILISPMILGRAIKVSALTVLIAILVGYQLLGLAGLLLAVPLAGTLSIVLAEYRQGLHENEPEKVAQAVDRVKTPNDDIDY